MSEAVSEAKTPTRSAGSLLREARQAQGIHIAALAATIKVAQRKLESLEADRLDELPDATFTRALAQTVCRALKADPAPVLALLPGPPGHRLEHVSQGINQPFRERARGETGDHLSRVTPGMWAALVLIVLAAVVYLLPQSWLSGLVSKSGGVPGSDASSSSVSIIVPSQVALANAPAAPLAASEVAVPMSPEIAAAPPVAASEPTALPASAPASAATPVAASVAASVAAALPASTPGAAQGAAPDDTLRLRAAAPTWLEVRDARSRVVLSRLVREGEELTLDVAAPLRVKIGNARAAQLIFRGKPVDLPASTRDNVARLELR